MDIVCKILLAFSLLVVGIDIIKLYHKTEALEKDVEELNYKVHGITRNIRREIPSYDEVADISDYRIIKFFAPIINVGDKKGTDE